MQHGNASLAGAPFERDWQGLLIAVTTAMLDAGDPPTSTTVEVSRLVTPGALVEVDLVAAVPPQA